ncbi:MAG: hypothetical protein ACXAD7_18935 [Candidatus Kariarchaeaceae archaeon]|jgi:hypothetical protein
MSTVLLNQQLYSHQFTNLTEKLHHHISKSVDRFDNIWNHSYKLSHEELVSITLLEVLADKYHELDTETRDSLIMMLIENQVLVD